MALHLPCLAIEARPAADVTPAAVIQGRGAQRRLIACNSSAREGGLAAGIDVPSALMRLPTLRLLDRAETEERRALQALACWAHRFSADVNTDLARWTLSLELGASLRYFGGLENIQQAVEEDLQKLGYTVRVGVAPALAAAALLAEAGSPIPITSLEELRTALGAVSLACLPLDAKTLDQLRASGLVRLEDLLRIPSAALARRFGPKLPAYLRRLTGEDPDPRPRHRIPPTYKRRFDFLEPIEALEGLLFPLKRLFQELQAYLRARDVAIQHLAITLYHRDAPNHGLELTTSSPQREAVQLLALIREKLERAPLKASVTGIGLAAADFVAPNILQHDLFDDRQRQQMGWTALLDRLRARLGSEAIRHLGLREDHRPERAWCVSVEPEEGSPPQGFPDRPLWLLTPTPITELPPLLGTPERIEAGWWQGEDTVRDYYMARTTEGARWWLYRDRADGSWYLQGLWA